MKTDRQGKQARVGTRLVMRIVREGSEASREERKMRRTSSLHSQNLMYRKKGEKPPGFEKLRGRCRGLGGGCLQRKMGD